MASMTNKKKTSFKRTEKYQRTGYKFIAPGLLMMVLLIIYPMLYGAYLSFYNTNLVNKSLRKESKVVQTKKQYGDFSLTALSFASISIFSG